MMFVRFVRDFIVVKFLQHFKIGTARMFWICISLLMTSSWGFALQADNNATDHIKPVASQNFSHHAILDANYELYWDFNETHIIFETHVKTNGYIGFGISPNGAMPDSDVIIGWVKDGRSYFSDRHTTGHFLPPVDKIQDWFLLQALEIGEYTSLKMVRKLETCDPEDRPILTHTTRVIFSYSKTDPTSESDISYHGSSNRGTKSLLLLDSSSMDKGTEKLPANVITIDFLNKNFSVPSKATTYNSTMIKLRDLGQKHHMIRFEPIIQKGHERLVHHIVIYSCTKSFDDSKIGFSYDSAVFQTGETAIEANDYCQKVWIVWAVGGTAFDYPKDVGQSLGTSEDPVWFRIETHYDNPDLRSDFVDNSGLRMYLTTDLRQHDAAVLEIGAPPDPSLVIPPYEKNFLSRSYCAEDCISGGIGDQEIHVFAVVHHAHLLGRKMRARHFRYGVELPPLSEDNNYDFNFQEARAVKPEITIRKGDSLVNECDYDSSERTNATFGGASTHNEMCFTFIWYYPKTPLSLCQSRILYKLPTEYASKNATIQDLANQQDWTNPDVRESFNKMVTDSDIASLCFGYRPNPQWHMRVDPQPNITSKYQAPSRCPST